MLWLVCSLQIFEVDTHLNRLILLAIHRYSCEINLFLPHSVCGAVQTAEVSPSDHCSAVSHCGSGRKNSGDGSGSTSFGSDRKFPFFDNSWNFKTTKNFSCENESPFSFGFIFCEVNCQTFRAGHPSTTFCLKDETVLYVVERR